MAIEFEPKNKLIVLKAGGDIPEKITFVRNLYDKACEKINHFDRLRQQILNFAIIVFSSLIAFVMKTEDTPLKIVGCFGIAGLMVIFRYLDQRYHTSTHGFGGSMFIFNYVIAHLLNDQKKNVSFFQYHTESEKTVEWWSPQTKIYLILALSAFVFGVVIWVKMWLTC